MPPPNYPCDKRFVGEPEWPRDIEVCAKCQWSISHDKMKLHNDDDYPSNFRFIQGTCYWMLDNLLEGININPEDYSPILQTLSNGNLKYVKVTPYNQKWLPKDAAGKEIPEKLRIIIRKSRILNTRIDTMP